MTTNMLPSAYPEPLITVSYDEPYEVPQALPAPEPAPLAVEPLIIPGPQLSCGLSPLVTDAELAELGRAPVAAQTTQARELIPGQERVEHDESATLDEIPVGGGFGNLAGAAATAGALAMAGAAIGGLHSPALEIGLSTAGAMLGPAVWREACHQMRLLSEQGWHAQMQALTPHGDAQGEVQQPKIRLSDGELPPMHPINPVVVSGLSVQTKQNGRVHIESLPTMAYRF